MVAQDFGFGVGIMSKESRLKLYELLSIIFLLLSFSISKYGLFNLSDKYSFISSLILLVISIVLYIISKKRAFKNKSIFSEKVKIVLYIVSLVIILMLLYI